MTDRLRIGLVAGVVVGWAITLGLQVTPDAWLFATPVPILLLLYSIYKLLNRLLPNTDPAKARSGERSTPSSPKRPPVGGEGED